MRVALYHRVSSLDQDPTIARGELQAAARQRAAAVVLDVEETGSGAKSDRPGLARILAAARAGQLDAVLVWKLDRFGRSTVDLLTNVRALRADGVAFVATSQGIDLSPASGAVGQLLLTMLAAVAEFERELAIDRTHLGIAKARAAGKRIGRPPALMSDPLIARAAKLRAYGAPEHWRGLMPWRRIRAHLVAEGFQNVPSHATIAREVARARLAAAIDAHPAPACTKPGGDSDGGAPPAPRG